MSFEQFLSELPSFTRAQLEEVRRKAAFLLQHKSADHDGVEDEDWLLSGILVELQRRGLESPKYHFRIKKGSSFAAYATKSAEVRDLLKTAAPNLTAVEYKLLGEIVAAELAKYLRVEISLSNMLNFVRLVPQAIENSFPGYLEAGLLSVIVRKK